MAGLAERLQVEAECVRSSLAVLPEVSRLGDLSALELAGVAAVLHNVYNGIENLLKQALAARGVALPSGPTWHRDLLGLAEQSALVSPATATRLRPLLAFRHFFSHGYALDLSADRMEALVCDAPGVFEVAFLEIRAATVTDVSQG